MSTILKVECDGDLRRAMLKGTPSYADIDRAIKEIWPGRSADGAKYKDEEGDFCTLKEQTFPDFLGTSQQGANGNVLRLLLPEGVTPEAVDDGSGSPSAAFARPWEHVEEGSEAEGDKLHTVADLTDEPEEEQIAEKCAEQVPATSSAEVSGEDAGYPAHEASSQQDADEVDKTPSGDDDPVQTDEEACPGRARVHSIHTPENSPRGDSQPQQEVLTEHDQSSVERSEDTAPSSSTQDVPSGAEENAASSSTQEPLVIDHDVDEKIDIVLAAFDENGDGHLNFAETNALHTAAWGGSLPEEVFQKMCTDEGEDPEIGLGRESLMCIYSRCRTLERDFEAAKAKLEGLAAEEHSQRQSAGSSQCSNPIDMIFKNPLYAVEDVAARLRKGVASKLTCKR